MNRPDFSASSRRFGALKRVLVSCILSFLLLPLLLAAGPDGSAYWWHRGRRPEAEKALALFRDWKIYALHAEFRQGRPAAVFSPLPGSVPVIRLDRSVWREPAFLKRLLPLLQKLPEGEVQLDCDVPESKIEAYASFLKALKTQDGRHFFSVTILPCHLKHQTLAAVLREVRYAVLQLHALETPPDLPQEYRLFDAVLAEKAVAAMKNFGTPFKIALPSYAYTVHYTETGKFRRMSAENEPPPRRGELLRTAQPDWRAVAAFRRRHKALDVIWFRLPVKGDRLALEAENLIRLQQGSLPRTEVEVFCRQEGAATGIYWKNHGLPGRVPHRMKLEGTGEILFFNGASAVSECVPGTLPAYVTGELPPPGETFLIAKIIHWKKEKK